MDTKKTLPGLIFVFAISYVAILINTALKDVINLESLTIAIIIGIIYNNTVKTQKVFLSGVKFSLKKLLKLGIILLGFKLNMSAIMNLGPKVLVMVLIFVPAVLVLSNIIGKAMKVETKLSTLIGVGSCICGASAVVAMAPCIDASEEDSVIAVSIVSFLGAIGVIIYTIVSRSVDISAVQYGIWSGLSLHGVAHAIAAAFAMGDVSGEVGTFVKMARVLMLVPVSLGLSYVFRKGDKNAKADFPVYVLYFIGAGILNSTGILHDSITSVLVKLSGIFIMMAMTAMGLSVDFNSIKDKGIRALASGSVLFAAASISTFFIIVNVIQ